MISENGQTFQSSHIKTKNRRYRLTAITIMILFMWDVKEPTPPFEKSRGHRPRWCGQPSHIIHIMGWVGIQQTHKWSDIGCQWRPCTLTCELTVNMLIYKTVEKLLSTTVLFRTTMLIHIVKRACLLSSHPRLLPSFLPYCSSSLLRVKGFFSGLSDQIFSESDKQFFVRPRLSNRHFCRLPDEIVNLTMLHFHYWNIFFQHCLSLSPCCSHRTRIPHMLSSSLFNFRPSSNVEFHMCRICRELTACEMRLLNHLNSTISN